MNLCESRPNNILFVPVASPIHDKNAVNEVIRRYEDIIRKSVQELSNTNVLFVDLITSVTSLDEVLETISRKNICAVLIGIITGGTERIVLELSRKINNTCPFLIISHDTQNSLAAGVEALSRIRLEKIRTMLYILSDPNIIRDLKIFLYSSIIKKLLNNKNLLVIGDPSPWLVYSSVDWESTVNYFGINVIKINLDELIDIYQSLNTEDIKEELKELLEKIINKADDSITRKDILDSLRLYLALKRLLNKYNAIALTIRCFDLLRYNVTACLALSILNDEGYIAGCEGDIPTVISMILSSLISNSPVFMANISKINKKNNTILFAHCTSPTKIGRDFIIKTHYESNISTAIELYPYKNKTVTIVKLDGCSMKLRVGRGKLLNDKPVSKDACRTQFLIKLDNATKLLEDPIGNHYVIILGDYVDILKIFSEVMDLHFELI